VWYRFKTLAKMRFSMPWGLIHARHVIKGELKKYSNPHVLGTHETHETHLKCQLLP